MPSGLSPRVPWEGRGHSAEVLFSGLLQMAQGEHLFCRKFTQLLLQTPTEVACSFLVWFCLVELQGGLGPQAPSTAPSWFCGVNQDQGPTRP